MFDSIGWMEIFFIIIIGFVIIGPEKLPGVIEDIKAAIYAARKAINNAKAELNDDFGEDFEELRKPLNTVSQYAAMGPKRAVAKVLFDENEDYLDQFDPKKMMEDDPEDHTGSGTASQNKLRRAARDNHRTGDSTTASDGKKDDKGDYSTGGGFSWEDIT
ncbi:Sec-independent protein translocase TatB [Corynebacterium cystitidis]|uniref:Sec-independent protein translocase protein TatB n=1 Tax=Corynebacterium cystitidis DSM 20524 TaxID=1121357 RepID=A0A1H9RWC2_9CORY|nr:Sec-independent protein translocase TatB [Corynebacterium cystitidis]WJY82109.1 sec-independent translocase [Corynebacterium cystitidis DSM 20524]SER77056.1 sec-independent protein translocase protein TatB [Corynebacterium cystitidis DSM 20524]SNV79197.1 sec-independent translocase [Corynebacterium cystitidis]